MVMLGFRPSVESFSVLDRLCNIYVEGHNISPEAERMDQIIVIDFLEPTWPVLDYIVFGLLLIFVVFILIKRICND
jgi:hypothetical protein